MFMLKTLFTYLCISLLLVFPTIAVASDLRVIDGDTVVLNGSKIRLYGIDAPEKQQTCQTIDGYEWSCGTAAIKKLKDLVYDQQVHCDQKDIDRYGRIVAVCFADGKDINREMVREGRAVAYRKYSRDYIEDEEYARKHKLGVWQGQFMMPWNWRKNNKGRN